MIAITGVTGLLGSHLACMLITHGKEVKALRRNSSSLKTLEKVAGYYSDDVDRLLSHIHWYEGDVTDYSTVEDFLDQGDHLYHCAGIVSFEKSSRHLLHKVNVEGTANIVNAGLQNNIARLIHVSSISALGRAGADGSVNEQSQWKNSKHNTEYSISKMLGEREVWRGQMEGLSTAIVNPGIIIGPGPWSKGSSQLITKLWSGLKYYSSGVNGYVDVRDVAKVMLLLMNSGIEGERFVLVAENIDYKQLFEKIAKVLNVTPPQIRANIFLAEIVWRMDMLRSFFTGKAPVITKETARTAMSKHYYDGSKITHFIDFQYHPLDDSINYTGKKFLKDIKH
ncbi:MAG: NAD-dependent epimerase/dehydratase family protein [Bacteroidales bacterium]|nr:NAD-dependent epimerase/dehydratase family protein [Bacteroidales bacterium]